MSERIVITGWGCLTSVGNNVQDTWDAIKQGKTGVAKIAGWDTTNWEYSLGSELKNFDPKLFLDRKLLKLLSRHDTIGLGAADQAVRHSQLLTYRDSLADPTEFNERTGVYVSSPGSKYHQQYDYFPLLTLAQGSLQQFGAELNSTVHPMWLLRTLPNNVLAYTGILNGFKGANQNIVNHSVGGIQAITEAAFAIQRGAIDRAVVVGYDVMLEPQMQIYYSGLGVVSKQGIKSFDENRDGTILGEGSGAITIETLTSAQARGATIYGELLTGITTTEGEGIFPIREDGAGLVRLLQNTLDSAQLTPESIGMITAHANGARISDGVEAKAIASIFSETQVPVTGFKWALGHTFSASGVIETILTLLSLQGKMAPGIGTLQNVAADCKTISVSNTHQVLQKPVGLVVSRGFGSINSCLAVTTQVQ